MSADRRDRALLWLREQRPGAAFTERDAERFLAGYDQCLSQNPGTSTREVAERVLAGMERAQPPAAPAPAMPPELAETLRQVALGRPDGRPSWRDQIEAHGAVALAPMLAWLEQEGRDELAAAVLRTLAGRGHAREVLDGLDSLDARGRAPNPKRVALLRTYATAQANRHPAPPKVRIWRAKIEADRRRLGLPPMTAAEVAHLVELGVASEQNPHLYRNHCWSCTMPVVEGVHRRCRCNWLECFCGACVSPRYGYCEIGAERFPQDFAEAVGAR